MLSTTNLDIVRRTNDAWTRAGISPEVQSYVRWEYNGDASHVLGEIARAGRAKPANPATKAGFRAFVRRIAAHLSSARQTRQETPAEVVA